MSVSMAILVMAVAQGSSAKNLVVNPSFADEAPGRGRHPCKAAFLNFGDHSATVGNKMVPAMGISLH